MDDAEVDGQTGWHSGRKSFCKAIYEALGNDLISTRSAMRHSSVLTTAVYLHADRNRVEEAFLRI